MKFYPRETKTVSLRLSADVVDLVEKIAKGRDMSFESILKFFISQGLRAALSPQEAKEFALKRLKSRKGSEENLDVDLAA